MTVPQHKLNLHVISYIIIIALSLIFQTCEENSSPNELNLSAPSNLQIEISNTGAVKVSWKPNSSGEQGFQIERKTGNSSTYLVLASVDNSRNYYIDSTSKSADSLYYYRIRAYYNYNYGDYSAEVPLSLNFTPPTDLKYISEDLYSVNISWTDTVPNEQGFQIERKAQNGTYTAVGRVSKNVTSFADSSLLTGETKYFYRVRSFGPGILSAPSNEVEMTPAFTRPVGLTASFVEDSIAVLNFTVNNTKATGLKIDYADSSKKYVSGDNITTIVSTYNQKAAYKLNIPYYFRVYNIAGNRISKASDSAAAFISFKRPDKFKLVSATEGKLQFTWNDSSSFEKGFELERKEGATGAYTKFSAAIAANSTSFSIDTVIKTNTWYYFKLRAVTNKKNYSPDSAIDSVYIDFAAPTGFEFTEVSPTTIKFKWFDNSSIEDSFRIERTSLIDNRLTIFKVPANTQEYEVSASESVPYSFKIRAVSPKKNLTTYAGELRVMSSASRLTEVRRISDTAQITCTALDTAGQRILVGYANGIVKVLDVNSGNTLRTITDDSTKSRVNSIDVSPDNNKFVVGYSNGLVVVWDINTGSRANAVVFPNACTSVAWSKITSQIGVGFSDGKSYIINPITFVKRSLTPDHLGAIQSISFGLRDTLVVTASADSSIKIFKVATGVIETALPNSPAAPVLSAGFFVGNDRRLVYLDKSGTIRTRSSTNLGSSYSTPITIGSQPSGMGFMSVLDYNTIISVGSDNSARLIRYPSVGVVNTQSPHTSLVTALTVSANKKAVAFVAKDNSISIWKVDLHWEKL